LGRTRVCGVLWVLWSAGCGQVAHEEPSPTSAEAGAAAGTATGSGGVGGLGVAAGGSSGGVVFTLAGQSGVAGTESAPEHTLCGNEVVGALPDPAPDLGFVGTFDEQEAVLFPESETSGTPFFQILHRQRRLQSITFGFAIKDTAYNGYLQIRTDQCRLVGNLFRPGDDGLIDFEPQMTSFSCATVTDDWSHGVTTGALHAVFQQAASGERHVLDGTFTFTAGFSDSSIGLSCGP
jgi:hypothetical protein